MKAEMDKNKEIKDNIRKFREEAQKLEESDALKSARQKFNIVESEAQKSSSMLKEQLGAIKERVGDVLEDASKSHLAKKVTEELSKKARGVSDTISDTSGKLGQTSAFQAISNTTTTIKKEMDSASIENRVYRAPAKLRKRVQLVMSDSDRVVEPNTEATGESPYFSFNKIKGHGHNVILLFRYGAAQGLQVLRVVGELQEQQYLREQGAWLEG